MPPDNSFDLRPPPPPPAPLQEKIQLSDRFCTKCGYNLRGIPIRHACPECGTFNPDRPFNDELQFADPSWVARLAWGATLLLSARFLWLIIIAAALSLTMLDWDNVVLGHFLIALPLIATFLTATGFWLVTSSESTFRAGNNATLRWTLRVSMSVAALAFSCMVVIVLLGDFMPGPALLFPLASICLIPAIILRTIFAGYMFQELARRIPDETLGNRILVASWVIFAGTILAATLFLPAAQAAPNSIGMAFLCIGTALLPFLLSYLWGLYLLWRFTCDLRACAWHTQRNAGQ